MFEIRPATDDDREQLAQVSGIAFNYQAKPEHTTVDGTLCSVVGGRVVASSTARPFQQWFSGRSVTCAGIAAMVVLPEYRGRRVASDLMREVLRVQRQDGRAVSTLFPANAGLYRNLGYEYGGLYPVHIVPLGDIPRRGALEVHEAGPTDTKRLMSCLSDYFSAHTGPVETQDEEYFLSRYLAHKGEGRHQRTILAEAPDGAVQGFASYYTGDANMGSYRVTCKQLVSFTPDALRGLLSYFTRFENAAKEFAWSGPPSDPLMGLALSSNAFSVSTEQYRWMERLVDVQSALVGRGYPAIEAEVRLEVADPIFPQNRGPWLLNVQGGKAEVTPVDGEGIKIDIGALSALYTGFASAQHLVLLGALEADRGQLGALSKLFAGSLPWSPHFF